MMMIVMTTEEGVLVWSTGVWSRTERHTSTLRLSANSTSAKVLEDGLWLLANAVLEHNAEDDFAIDPLGNARQRQHQTLENAHRTGLNLSSAAHRTGSKVDREARLLDCHVLTAVDVGVVVRLLRHHRLHHGWPVAIRDVNVSIV